jgi:hypothetical protein
MASVLESMGSRSKVRPQAMDIVVCIHCQRSVIPMANGACPSCQKIISSTARESAGTATNAHQTPGAPADDHLHNPYVTPEHANPAAQGTRRSAGTGADSNDIILSVLAPFYGILIGILALVFKGDKARGKTMIKIGLITMGVWTVIMTVMLLAERR